MRAFSYLWTAVISIVEIFITLTVFSNIFDDTQIKIVAILVIIYTTIRTIGAGLGQALVGLIIMTNKEFRTLRQIIDKEYLQTEKAEDDIEEEKKAMEVFQKNRVKTYITGTGLFIMYIIAVLHLF